MGFNLFGPAKTSDIRVGYISPDRGYVEGISICDANSYARLNPGTTFILKNREKIRYLNINEVNKLKPGDAFVSSNPEECGGIQLDKPDGPPRAEFYGGGGVGVKANPVIGDDGSVMAVHVVAGGNGYKFPPIVQIKDGGSGNKGGGVVARAGIGATTIKTEVYDAEDEFEEYFPNKYSTVPEGFTIKQLCQSEKTKEAIGFGRRYSPTGKDLGPWNPAQYVSDEDDPIRRQIAQFQEYLAALTDPWWFIRKNPPISVVSDNEEQFVKNQKKLNFDTNKTVYPVHHWHWGGSQLKHGTVEKKPGAFEDVVFQVYSQGGKGKDLFFTFTEVGGKHTFTVKADDYAGSGEPRSITKHIKPNVDYKVTSEGRYKKQTGTEQGLLRKNFGSRGAEKGLGTSSSIFADVLGTANDNDDLQILAKTGRFKSTNERKVRGHSTYDLTYRLTVPSTKGRVSNSQKSGVNDIARSFMNDHAISPVPMSNSPGSDFAGMLFTMEWEQEFPFPGEYTFKGQCDNEARAFLDNQPLMPKIAYFRDKPTVVKKYLNWDESDTKGKVYKLKIDLSNTVQYKEVTIQEPPSPATPTPSNITAKFEGTNKDDIFLVVSGSGTADAEIKLDTNDSWSAAGLSIREMRCGPISLVRTKGRKRETLTGSGTFAAGRHKVEIIGAAKKAGHPRVADTRIELLDDHGDDTNASLTLKVKSVNLKPQPPAKPKPVTSGIKVQKVFNTVDWMGKANRQLWRTNVYGRGGFVNTAGVCPFDTSQTLETNPYAGTHSIKWRNISFPIDGNYTIKVAVDDNVNLRFHGPAGDVSVYKDGFVQGQSTGTSTYTKFFRKGNYTLDADLEQIPGGRFSFRHEGKIKDKEVNFNIKVGGHYGNKITIPGLFSLGKDHISAGGSAVKESFVKKVEVGKEYDVVITSIREAGGPAETVHRKGAIRVQDSGSKLEFEDKLEGVGSSWNWDLIQATVSEGKFYGIHGNKCKFKLEETTKGINPMVLAVDVEVAYAKKTVISARSWQENPMGVAFTIKAPIPPVPVEEKPKQEGRCPNNPMWTTRFPTTENWYPVMMDAVTAKKHGHPGRGWSSFLNRWAISPVLPLNTLGTDAGGKVFTNTWKVDIPYDGYYQIKGEADDIARYYVDNDLKLDLSRRKRSPDGRAKTSGTSKFFLKEGASTIRIEVENYETKTYKTISKKIFSASDWRRIAPVAPPPSRGIICHAGGGKGGTDNQEQLVGGKVIVGKGGDGGKGGDDNWADRDHGGKGGGAGLRNGGSATNSMTHTQIDRASPGKAMGGPGGLGVNFVGHQVGTIGQIISPGESIGGNGVAMGGGGGGNCRGGRGGNGGNGGVQITWGLTGKSQQWTTPGIYNVTVPGNIGKAKKSNTVPITAKFEGTSRDDLHLVVSGTGTVECTIKLQTNDSWSSKGVALTAMKCGSISIARTVGRKSETLSGTGTFVGGKRYRVDIIGADKNARPARIGDTRVELLDKHNDDTNASLNLSVSSQPQPMDGVTIVCIGGGGSGFMDAGGDRQGSGGSGGAYAWVNEDIEAGKQLKIVVGRGGKGKDVQGASSGGDSYVEVISAPPSNESKIIKQQQGKVSYSGPNLFHYTDSRWGKVINKYGVSPANVDATLDKPTSDNVGTKILEWKNVDFPMKGRYDILFAADNKAELYINGEQLLFADENYTLASEKSYDKINIGTPGRYDVKIKLINTHHRGLEVGSPNDDVFRNNPSGVALEIRKDVSVVASEGKSWTQNPMGVAGVLVPPPCPKIVGGKGVVDVVVIDDPGTGFTKTPEQPDDVTYPVVLTLKGVRPSGDPINYDCAKDTIRMVPDLGYKFGLTCGPFGEIEKITVTPPVPPPPITRWPGFYIDSPTGINLKLIPEFDITIVPPDVLPPEDIIQVTDLAGIKQTGYYNGKPYYGAVYYDNGIKYAGWYATAGQPIQIYDTLQESIDAAITTLPSAIQRQGSDVTSNDPRLNIPGTPENLT